MKQRFVIEEAIKGERPHDSRYEIWDMKEEEIVGTFYCGWFLKKDVQKVLSELRKRCSESRSVEAQK